MTEQLHKSVDVVYIVAGTLYREPNENKGAKMTVIGMATVVAVVVESFALSFLSILNLRRYVSS
jgi:hypothetical protein